MVERWLGVVTTALGLFVVRPAMAQEPAKAPQSAAVGQENFGFGASLGFFNPNGAELRIGARAIALDVSGGYAITATSYTTPQPATGAFFSSGTDEPHLKFLAPLEVSPQLVINAVTLPREIRGALRLGYRYNTVLGHAGTLAGQVGKRWGHFLLEGIWGISIYPDAADKLRSKEVPRDASFRLPPALGWGLSVSGMYFP